MSNTYVIIHALEQNGMTRGLRKARVGYDATFVCFHDVIIYGTMR